MHNNSKFCLKVSFPWWDSSCCLLGLFSCWLVRYFTFKRQNFDCLKLLLVLDLYSSGPWLTCYFLRSGKISPWTGRFYSLLDPSYAKNNIPIIASVSEHQPTTWSSYYFDLQLLVFMFPGKCCLCWNMPIRHMFILHDSHRFFSFPFSWSLLLFQQSVGCQNLHHYVWCHQHVFLRCHGMSCNYLEGHLQANYLFTFLFSSHLVIATKKGLILFCIQVRLMLVLAPVMCILSGIGVSQVLTTYMKNLDVSRLDKKSKKQQDSTYPIKNEVRTCAGQVKPEYLGL